MRVYQRGVYTPMDKVTFDILCKASTLVTVEDPDVDWPEAIKLEIPRIVPRIKKLLGINNSPMEMYRSKLKRRNETYESLAGNRKPKQ